MGGTHAIEHRPHFLCFQGLCLETIQQIKLKRMRIFIKFNVRMSHMYIVEIEHHCTNYSAKKLRTIIMNCKNRDLIKLNKKIERIDEIYAYLDEIDEELSKLLHLCETIVVDETCI